MKIYLVRHGQTDYNLNDLIQGWVDIELNENGIKQSMELGEKLKDIKFDVIYSSDLKRAIQTSEIINKINKFKSSIILDSRLREQNMGDWEGKKSSIIINENKEFFIKVRENPFLYNPPNGETFLQVVSRAKAFLDDLEDKNYENILIVGHQLINAIIFFILNNLDWKLFWDYKQKNGEVWILDMKTNRAITNA
jgi:broad specificity phosphatase PhoE